MDFPVNGSGKFCSEYSRNGEMFDKGAKICGRKFSAGL